MVSLNTILSVGGLAAAYIIFTRLGGASGIGSSIGGGFTAFGDSLVSSLNPIKKITYANTVDALNPFSDGGIFGRDYEEWLKGNDMTPDGGNFVVQNEEVIPPRDTTNDNNPWNFGDIFPWANATNGSDNNSALPTIATPQIYPKNTFPTTYPTPTSEVGVISWVTSPSIASPQPLITESNSTSGGYTSRAAGRSTRYG